MKIKTPISDELHLIRTQQGVKLILPTDATPYSPGQIISNLMQTPLHVYFLNRNSTIQKINQKTIDTCDFQSIPHATSKTISELCDKTTAEFSLNHDRLVLTQNKVHIAEEHFIRLDGLDFQAISIKYPWYDNNQLVGVFGCSFTVGCEDSLPLSSSLTTLMQLGLMIPTETPITSLPLPNNVYFSKREMEVLPLLMRGKKAKEIAAILSRSPRTIEHHIENMKIKTHSHSKSELIDKMFSRYCKD